MTNSQPLLSEGVQRRPYLDGLRGAASCVVFLGHLWLALTGQNAALLNANAAVCIFFVLSAFVLSAQRRRSSMQMAALVARRYVRLVVPMLITSAIACALLKLHVFRNAEAAALNHSTWLGYWYQFRGSFHEMALETTYGVFKGRDATYNSNLWTMRPELLGSFFVFVVGGTPNRAIRTAGYVVLLLVYPFNYVFLFAAGAVIYDYEREIREQSARLGWGRSALWIAILAAAIICCLVAQPGASSADQWFQWLPIKLDQQSETNFHMGGAVLLVIATLNLSFLQEWFSSRVALFFGRISFTLYLLHLPILCSFTAWLIILNGGASTPSQKGIIGCSTVAFVLLVSTALNHLVDEWPVIFSQKVGLAVDSRIDAKTI